MEYKESENQNQANESQIMSKQEEPEPVTLDIVIDSLFEVFSIPDHKQFSDVLEDFNQMLHNTYNVPLDMLMEKNLIGFFLDVLSNSDFSISFRRIIEILTFLAGFRDLNITQLYAPESLDLVENNVLPVVNDLVVIFKYYTRLTASNIPACKAFYETGIHQKIANSIFEQQLDPPQLNCAINIITNILISLSEYINEKEDLKIILLNLTDFILEITKQTKVLTSEMLYAAFAAVTLTDESIFKMLTSFPLEVLFITFQEGEPSCDRLIFSIIKAYADLGDPRLFEKWDLSMIVDVLDNKPLESQLGFLDLCSALCKMYLSFVRYILSSGIIQTVIEMIETGLIVVKEKALQVVTSILKHQNYDWFENILDLNIIETLADFISLESGTFLRSCAVALTNITMMATANEHLLEKVLNSYVETDIFDTIESIYPEIKDLNTKCDFQVLMLNLTDQFPEHYQTSFINEIQ